MDAEKIMQDLNQRFTAPPLGLYKRRIIFWYDEGREFENQIGEISLSGAKLIKLNGSNCFAVKKLLPVDDTAGNYLVYCPVSFEHPEDNRLLNIRLYSGEPFRVDLNTVWVGEVGLPASQMFRKQVKQYHKFFNSKDHRTRIVTMTGSIDMPAQMHLAMMAIICDVKDISPNSIIRAVLKVGLGVEDSAIYRGIVDYRVQAAFWALIAQATGYGSIEEQNLAWLAVHILLTAATRTLHREYLSSLDSFISTPHQSFCYDFVSDWLHSDDLHDLYKVARIVETEARLYQRLSKLSVEGLRDTGCFPCISEMILTKMMVEIEDQIIQVDMVARTIEKRRTMVWYAFMSNYYRGLLQTAKVQAFFLERSAGFHTTRTKDIWGEYAIDYYRVDSHCYAFHLCFRRSLKISSGLLDDLLKHVVERVKALYSEWYLSGLGDNWSNVAAEEPEKHGYIEEVNRHTAFYLSNIQHCDTRVFVIVSGALRYEVAASLSKQLRREAQSKVTLDSMCGILLTTTPYGMAALLPHKKLPVQARPDNGLAVLTDGQSTESTNRDKLLRTANPASVVLQYRNTIGLRRADRQALIKGMEIVHIYYDKIGEASRISDSSVFPACDEAIEEIKDLVRIIVNGFSGTCIPITTNHGFLYTYNPLTEDDKAPKDSWDGKEVDYGRRYVIMEKDAQPEYLTPVQFLDDRTDYAAFAPHENVRIEMNSDGPSFVHGDVSLQEMVIPLINYHYIHTDNREYRRDRAKIDMRPIKVSLLSVNRKISDMVFSFNLCQKDAVGDNREKANYLLYFADSAGKVVNGTARIIADKTGDTAQERTFRCTFNLKSLSFGNKEIYYPVATNESGLRLPQREEFQIDIASEVDGFKFF